MLTKDLIDHFGTQALTAEKLGVTQSSVAEWGKYPPELRQIHAQRITRGKLKAEPDCFMPKKRAAA